MIISLAIESSEEQVVWGIPHHLTVEANIPCTIFYTLDGTTPTTSSDIYIDGILLPTNVNSVSLKLYATNGIDTSAVITQVYSSKYQIDGVKKLPAVTDQGDTSKFGPAVLPPCFGSVGNLTQTVHFFDLSRNGREVDDGIAPSYNSAVDANGNPSLLSNEPWNPFNYEIVEAKFDSRGNALPGILPVPDFEYTPDMTSMYSVAYDPRAKVIIQDLSLEDENSPINIASQYFSMHDNESATEIRNRYNANAGDAPCSASYLNSYFNPKTNTVQHFFYDRIALKWLIIKDVNPAYEGDWTAFKEGLSLGRGGGRYLY
jgi:hypothetical protein